MDIKDCSGVCFKNEEAKKKWLDFIDKNPAEASTVLIGFNIKRLEGIINQLASVFEKEMAFNSLSDEEKKKALDILESTSVCESKIQDGTIQLNKESQNLLDSLSAAVRAKPEALEAVSRAQETLKEIEFLVNLREDLEKESFKGKDIKEKDKSEVLR